MFSDFFNQLDLGDWLTLVATIVTIAATAFSIFQAASSWRGARKAEAAKREVIRSVEVISLAQLTQRISALQHFLRDIPPERVLKRGSGYQTYAASIRREFDGLLSALPAGDVMQEIRKVIGEAQHHFNQYINTISANSASSLDFESAQRLMQDAAVRLAEATSIRGGAK